MRLGAVTLDAAGTLITPREPVETTYSRIAAMHGLRLDRGVTATRFAAALRDAPPLAFPDTPVAETSGRERAWWRAVVGATFGPAAADRAFADCFDALYAHYADPGAWLLHADATAALGALRGLGLRLAVVSNFDGRLPAILDGLGVAALVDDVLHSTAVGVAKPDARIFRLAAERLRVGTDQLLHIGDDVITDVRGARAAGCRALLVVRRARGAPPHGVTVVRNLAGAVEFIRAEVARR
jgi:putative hydrolase of the HAD superfamily